MIHDTDIFLILKRLDAFEEELKKLENEIKILKQQTPVPRVWPNDPSKIPPVDAIGKVYRNLSNIPCYFDNLSPEDRMKPMGISCPCPKCSPYSLSQGSLSDAGTVQVWYQGLAKLGDDVEE